MKPRTRVCVCPADQWRSMYRFSGESERRRLDAAFTLHHTHVLPNFDVFAVNELYDSATLTFKT